MLDAMLICGNITEGKKDMKKLIRALIKIPATPFVLIWHLLGLLSGVFIMVYEWLYEDKNLHDSSWALHYAMRDIKNWFTTI